MKTKTWFDTGQRIDYGEYVRGGNCACCGKKLRYEHLIIDSDEAFAWVGVDCKKSLTLAEPPIRFLGGAIYDGSESSRESIQEIYILAKEVVEKRRRLEESKARVKKAIEKACEKSGFEIYGDGQRITAKQAMQIYRMAVYDGGLDRNSRLYGFTIKARIDDARQLVDLKRNHKGFFQRLKPCINPHLENLMKGYERANDQQTN